MAGLALPEMVALQLLAVALLGLCLGSFATALIYRIPRKIPWICNYKDVADFACRSKCPYCGHRLGPLDLIPILSWLLSLGKCRYCNAATSILYPLTEFVCAAIVVALYAAWGWQAATIPILFLVPFLIALIVIDWRHMILPDELNISAFILALFFLGLGGAGEEWFFHLIAGILFPAIFLGLSTILKLWKGQEMLGWGDLKFLPSAGLFLGLAPLPSYMILAGFLGLLTAGFYGFKGQKGAFPFGPAIIISLVLHLFLTGYGVEYTW